jgi:hypothetical protein
MAPGATIARITCPGCYRTAVANADAVAVAAATAGDIKPQISGPHTNARKPSRGNAQVTAASPVSPAFTEEQAHTSRCCRY